MKRRFLPAVAAALLAANSHASLTFDSGNSIGLIPDGNPVGVTFFGDVGSDTIIGALAVSLNISGGYAGNLYAYLVAPNGMMVELLDHPGVVANNPFGNSASSLSVTLTQNGTQIAADSNLSGQSYAAAQSLSGFNGLSANGTWQLFFADTVSGGGVSQLTSWSLDITAVPEPVNVALAVFCGTAIAAQLAKRLVSGAKKHS